ncbi:tetratricopeptide repeat protein [Polynucleobacter sp. Nonnen-W13]|uniref:tetratricopeptide repeat protein n=1 Tax=Polynucleobacter sp. Nonnen-W13 TaxID=1855625 RepID=UPI001C0BD923|nr:tetratricopeptide repeat protein [Polynucleobacter sp. Nonnen-W13]MBU3558516.1 tetratricopeptide repeat protein [Polynucleobacter sp. Nonnen-W13]
MLPSPQRLAQQDNLVALLIQQGLDFHKQGNFEEAQAIYEQVLAIQDHHFDALQLLGAIFTQTKQFIKAVEFINKALQINPDFVSCHLNCGIALQSLGRFDEALNSYDQAINFKPDYAEAYSNRGNTLKELKRFNEALLSYGKAISLKPDYAEAYSNLGVTLQALEHFEEALVSYDQAISLKPDYAEAHSNRGNTLKALERFDEALASYDSAIDIKPNYTVAYYNRGLALQELERFDEALVSYDQAISLESDYAEAYSDRGNTLQKLKRFDEALVSYDKAISLKPDYAQAFYNRGTSLQEIQHYDEALASYDKSISLKPDYAEAYSNRGNVLKEMGHFDGALASYYKGISIKPDSAEIHWNLSLCHLLLGNFQDGWQGYEWRWKNEKIAPFKNKRGFTEPLWLGEQPLIGKTIFLHAEQGLGDTIQFCRYVPLVAQLGAKVIVAWQAPLVNLLKNLEGVSQVITVGDTLPVFDYQCPLMSLPLAFKTELDSIPLAPQCITSDMGKVAKWEAKLGKKTKLRVGLVWSGSTIHKNDHNRSLTLSQLLPYLPPQIDYVCLQKELRVVDQALLEQHPEIQYFGDALEDFTDTAALCELVDVVISVDTSVAHLAGMLGKPTWVLLSFSPDWRWLLDRDDSPWYPSVKLYRQTEINDWDSVLKRTKADLEKMVG